MKTQDIHAFLLFSSFYFFFIFFFLCGIDLLHSLLEEREPPGLTDDQISPLYDDDGHEESRVARVLQLLSLVVGLEAIIITNCLEIQLNK